MLSKDEVSNPLKKSRSDCSQIGYKFVKDYYTTLNQDPSLVHVRNPLLLWYFSNKIQRFYKKQSTLTHGNEGGISETYVGQRVRKYP